MNYLIAKIKATGKECVVEQLDNVPKSYQLMFGMSRIKGFPADASFRMSEDFPKSLVLTDALDNTDSLLVASERLIKALQDIPGALYHNEILPVQILNHKGRKEKAQYAIVHQVEHIKCFNEAKCVGRKSEVNDEQFLSLKKMVLDEKKIDPKAMLFRAVEFPRLPLVRRDLAEKLKGERFAGITFHEIDGYDYR